MNIVCKDLRVKLNTCIKELYEVSHVCERLHVNVFFESVLAHTQAQDSCVPRADCPTIAHDACCQ